MALHFISLNTSFHCLLVSVVSCQTVTSLKIIFLKTSSYFKIFLFVFYDSSWYIDLFLSCDSLGILNLWIDKSDENSVKSFYEKFSAIPSNIASTSFSLFSSAGAPINVH